MIANLLALSAADEWDLETLILNSPEDLDRKWNPDEPRQFFWVDDAFGSNHCDFERVQEWNQRLAQLKAAIHKGARAIFTSRSYIFRAAQNRLNTHKFELFNDNRVTIEVENLSEPEKAMILYNHLKLGKQPKAFRSSVKDFLPMAVATPKFLPEVARRFANPKFTSKMYRNHEGVRDFFSNPLSVMADIVGGLANAERAALALVFASGGNLPIPLAIHDEHVASIIVSMQSNVGDVKAALSSLDDSLLRKVTVNGGQFWQFRHPTIRDAFASDVAGNPELVDIYLSGVTKERLVLEISCGTMDVEGVKLVVPRERYARVLGIIAPEGSEKALAQQVITFLATRCSNEFLGMFFNNRDVILALLGMIQSSSPFDSVLTIICRMNVDNLLENDIRLKVIERICFLAEQNHSDCFIDGDFVDKLLSKEENDALLAIQKSVLYSSMYEILDEIEDSWSVDEDVDDAFYSIRRLIERLQEENENLYGEIDYNEEESAASDKFLLEIDDKVKNLKNKQSDSAEPARRP